MTKPSSLIGARVIYVYHLSVSFLAHLCLVIETSPTDLGEPPLPFWSQAEHKSSWLKAGEQPWYSNRFHHLDTNCGWSMKTFDTECKMSYLHPPATLVVWLIYFNLPHCKCLPFLKWYISGVNVCCWGSFIITRRTYRLVSYWNVFFLFYIRKVWLIGRLEAYQRAQRGVVTHSFNHGKIQRCQMCQNFFPKYPFPWERTFSNESYLNHELARPWTENSPPTQAVLSAVQASTLNRN